MGAMADENARATCGTEVEENWVYREATCPTMQGNLAE